MKFRFEKFWFRKSGQWCCYACALLIWYFCFLCLFSLGYLLCSSFTAHCCLAFSPFWCVLRAWMGAPIKNNLKHRVGPVSHTTPCYASATVTEIATHTADNKQLWYQLAWCWLCLSGIVWTARESWENGKTHQMSRKQFPKTESNDNR